MLSTITQFLNAKFETLPYLNEVLGMGEVMEKDGAKLPSYNSNGEPVNIDFDTHQSLIFLLKNGKVSRDAKEHPHIANLEHITETYPLRAVIYSQGIEGINCSSQSQSIAQGVKKNISGNQNELNTAINAWRSIIEIKDTDLDKYAVWKSLYSEDSRLKETDTLIAIDFEVHIEGDEQCFDGEPCAVTDSVIFEDSIFEIIKPEDEMYDIIANSSQTFLLDGTTQSFQAVSYLDLRGKNVTEVFYDGIYLSPAYTPVPYSWNKTTGLLTFTIPINEGVAIHIKYTR